MKCDVEKRETVKDIAAIKAINERPPAQPEPTNDSGELINRSVAIDSIQYAGKIGKQTCIDILKHLPSSQQWIPVKTRPMDDEEREEYSERVGYVLPDDEAFFYMNLPDDGQVVLTCSRYGNIDVDTFERDPEYGCGFEFNGGMDGIVAWMPLPEPYKG